MRDAGGVAAAVRSPQRWARCAQGRAAARGPWLRFQSSGIPVRRWAAPDDQGDAPLRGLRVLDLTRVIAGPSASRLLDDAHVLLLDYRGVEYSHGPARYGRAEAWFLGRPPGA